MPDAEKTAITPTREQDFPEWYQQIVRVAELAEPSDVRGCMVIRPWGFGIWENMQRQLFLRTTEFLWQEGHTVHETEAEAREETRRMLDVYETFVRDRLAIPVFSGEKSESERFPGAVQTLSIEAMVQDRKAIQAGTSHFLGQNFSRASGIQFQNREGKEEFGWTTSWGVSARLVGTVVMMHGDDDGVVLPPRIAPTHIAILPITPKEETRATVLETCDKLARELRAVRYADVPIEADVDRRDLGGGTKNWEWIKKGVPLRVEIGPRDLEKNSVEVSRRDQAVKAKESMSMREFVRRAPEILDSIQQNLYEHARKFRDENTRMLDSKKEFYDFFTPKNSEKPEIHGGFGLAHWNGSREVEDQIKNDLKVTIRCIPPAAAGEPGRCIFSGEPSRRRVIWAKAY